MLPSVMFIWKVTFQNIARGTIGPGYQPESHQVRQPKFGYQIQSVSYIEAGTHRPDTRDLGLVKEFFKDLP